MQFPSYKRPLSQANHSSSISLLSSATWSLLFQLVFDFSFLLEPCS